MVSVALGAGRIRADQQIDPRVGLQLAKKPAERVERGEPLAWIHARSKTSANEQAGRVGAAFVLGRARPKPHPLVIERLTR